ncbi:MAG: 3-dehydroquinate synthase [Candidatus Cloacimonetes bacterium]|nr:3-dehydroquinate synthase [Candidatus Cloacimonadota bacterium]
MIKFNFGSRSSVFSFIDWPDLAALTPDSAVLIVDQAVYRLYRSLFSGLFARYPLYLLSASEKKKTPAQTARILDFFLSRKVTRETVVLAIGGGLVTDMAGYAASIYKRGCKLWMIPTTFLAMIDAAVGGKTGVNYRGVKNQLGSFYPAEKVFVLPGFLDTLSRAELQNGWAECLKVSFLEDSGLLEQLQDDRKIIDRQLLEKAVSIKAAICERDPFDRDERRKLNLGHTFAHLLEAVSRHNIAHGQAVALGLRAAAFLSLNRKLIDSTVLGKITGLLDLYDFPQMVDMDRNLALQKGPAILSQDKKAMSGENGLIINAVLFESLTRVSIYRVEITEIMEVLPEIIR